MRPIQILIAVLMACIVAGVGLAWEKSQNHNANRLPELPILESEVRASG